MSIVNALYGLLTFCAIGFTGILGKDLLKSKDELMEKETLVKSFGIGVFTDFFDTLGIGSFAPTTALLTFTKLISDKLIPGTLNVSHTIPVVMEAFLFIKVVEIDTFTLVSMILAAVTGSWLGAGTISKLEEKKIQLVMGVTLIITVIIMLLGLLGLMPVGGDSTELIGIKLIIGLICNFVLGAFMSAGIGLYAPCMALVSILGMNPSTAFPIMMGSCAMLMPFASMKFVKEGAYDKKVSLGITIGGIIGVILAVTLVVNIPIQLLKWLVVIVVTYTAITMIKKSKEKNNA